MENIGNTYKTVLYFVTIAKPGILHVSLSRQQNITTVKTVSQEMNQITLDRLIYPTRTDLTVTDNFVSTLKNENIPNSSGKALHLPSNEKIRGNLQKGRWEGFQWSGGSSKYCLPYRKMLTDFDSMQ